MSFWIDDSREIKRESVLSTWVDPLLGGKRTQSGSALMPQNTPLLSTGLDSARKSTFVALFKFPSVPKEDSDTLTRAIKHISEIGKAPQERIITTPTPKVVVDYSMPNTVTFTFDNILVPNNKKSVCDILAPWHNLYHEAKFIAGKRSEELRELFNYYSGQAVKRAEWLVLRNELGQEGVQKDLRIAIHVLSYGPDGVDPLQKYVLLDCYPVAIRTTDFASNENDFHTIELDIRWKSIAYPRK